MCVVMWVVLVLYEVGICIWLVIGLLVLVDLVCVWVLNMVWNNGFLLLVISGSRWLRLIKFMVCLL